MSPLTPEDILHRIEASPVPDFTQQSPNSHAHLPSYFALHSMVQRGDIPLHSVQTMIEASRAVALDNVRTVLRDVPHGQPLDEIHLGRIQSVLDAQSAIVLQNHSLFTRINPKHSGAVQQVAKFFPWYFRHTMLQAKKRPE